MSELNEQLNQQLGWEECRLKMTDGLKRIGDDLTKRVKRDKWARQCQQVRRPTSHQYILKMS